MCECCSVPKSFVTLWTGANTEGLGGCSGAQGLQQSLWPSPGCSIPEGKQRPKAPTCMGTSPHRSPPGLDPLAWDMQGSPGTRPGREMPRGPAGAAGAGSRPSPLGPFSGQGCCRILISVTREVRGRAEVGLFKRCSRVPRKQTERASQTFPVSLTPEDAPGLGTKGALWRSTAPGSVGSGQMRGCPPRCAAASWPRGSPFKVGGQTRPPGSPGLSAEQGG